MNVYEENKKSSPFEKAVWIEPSELCASPLFVKRFHTKGKKATLHISGLGWFEAKVNGEKISDHMFIPPASDYFRRSFDNVLYPVWDTFTHRTYYHSFDISDYLTEGENILEIRCGGGFFVQSERQGEGDMSYDEKCRCIFAIDTPHGQTVSDGSEKWVETHIRRSSLFYGEVHDFRFEDTNEKNVHVAKERETLFTLSDGAPDKIVREICPKVLKTTENGAIYDSGENISGLCKLTVQAPKGEKYRLTFSENTDESGNLTFESTGSQYVNPDGRAQIMEDEFITDGNENTFMPKFVWHAFRYFEIEGNLNFVKDVKVEVINSDTPLTAEFSSDSEGFNFLFDAYVRTQLSNFHCSFPSDCPHRERLGYTGDGQICAKTAMMMLDSKALYRKWIRDILDSQDIKTGHVQHTAPFQGGGGGPGGWGSAIVVVPYEYYRQFGDEKILTETLSPIQRHLGFMESCLENGLIVREAKGGWCLGDWCMLEEAKLPESFVNTCWYIHTIRLYNKMRFWLKLEKDEHFSEVEKECLEAVQNQYDSLKSIGMAKVYGAWIGIDSPDKCANFYEKQGYFDTGFLATDILMDILFKNGYGHVAGKLMESDKFGSFLYMKKNGATTIWETWDGEHSHSHPMFGACARQIFEGILGIRQDADSCGYEKVTISPYLPSHMNYAKGSILTPKGRIEVSLERKMGKVNISVNAPCDIIIKKAKK
ncbi:MAG: family 78 glycoside hydrolase catalytic domain [Clostridia bacterium]|nr:family 78 glycoside hydrolase catalytic domain [Clostridia bacterium]